MRDEIMRLADAAAELRALARTDHPEDKLGMVPEGWSIEQHNGGYMVNPPGGPGCWVSGRDDFNVPLADQTLAKLCAAMLAATAEQLRALARTDHPEDKLGMVEAGGASYQQDKNTRMTASEIITALVAIGDMESPAMLFVGGRSGWLTNVEDDHGQYVFFHAESYETEDGGNG